MDVWYDTYHIMELHSISYHSIVHQDNGRLINQIMMKQPAHKSSWESWWCWCSCSWLRCWWWWWQNLPVLSEYLCQLLLQRLLLLSAWAEMWSRELRGWLGWHDTLLRGKSIPPCDQLSLSLSLTPSLSLPLSSTLEAKRVPPILSHSWPQKNLLQNIHSALTPHK